MNLPVNLCGTDARGRAFIERVRSSNISRDGALLEGVQCHLNPGDVAVLRCEENTGRFRVVWKQDAENGEGKWLGLARLVSLAHTEDSEIPIGEPDTYQRPRVQVRREHPRYKCEIASELRLKGEQISMWVTGLNLSEGGCTVETVVAVPSMSEVKIVMWLDDVKLWAQGVVVTSQYGLGTGIKFTSMSRQDRDQLKEYLARTAGETSDRRAEAGARSNGEAGKEVHFRPGLDNVGQPETHAEFTVCSPIMLPEGEKILG
ncbi:MAG: PilZ domain-containing protein [Acidobacteriia bacterium]|nr:PilZ domain-containing protein [Terriglobia bacterium]